MQDPDFVSLPKLALCLGSGNDSRSNQNGITPFLAMTKCEYCSILLMYLIQTKNKMFGLSTWASVILSEKIHKE